MNNVCSICGNEKRYDDYHKMFRRCDFCNRKHALKYYYKNKDIVLEKRKINYDKQKISTMNKERYSKHKTEINLLKEQIDILTNRLNTITCA